MRLFQWRKRDRTPARIARVIDAKNSYRPLPPGVTQGQLVEAALRAAVAFPPDYLPPPEQRVPRARSMRREVIGARVVGRY